ncbi:hypothetical protein NQ318_021825 [Aromia moschata]|uniref:NADH dehydrogenase subunit 6 n=1 Tax=Aromia moschata TaxID=1265417 RepID=A0AAV8Z605_9CUCU|nr:hypothetical protein NQ318_021825 [Aromia moschata]
MILAIVGIILVLVIRADLKTIVFDFIDKSIVKIIVIINLVMTIILSIVMLVGVFKRKWFLMAPWVVLGGMLAIGLLVSIIINSINEEHTLMRTLWLAVGIPSLVVYCYMWYVCASFFSNLLEEAKRGAYTKDPFRRQRI